MRTFFHGWRRKAAVVSLVMASGLAGLWGRSCFRKDSVVNGLSGITSFDGVFEFWLVKPRSTHIEPESLRWVSSLRTPATEILDRRESIWSRNFVVLRISEDHGGGNPANSDMMTVRRLAIPHWSIVLSLTILSACLIFWKPRKRA